MMKKKLLSLLLVISLTVSILVIPNVHAVGEGEAVTVSDELAWSCGTGVTAHLMPSTTEAGKYILSISGEGEMQNYNNTSMPWVNYIADITAITVSEGVTYVGNSAFSGCVNLVSVSLPKSVTAIGARAFFNCEKLTSVDISNDVTSIGAYAFKGCLSLKKIKIPDGVSTISAQTFAECTSLSSIEIHEGITSIFTRAFSDCTALKRVYIRSSAIAKAITSATSCGYLCNYAETIVFSPSVSEISSFVESKFTNVDSLVSEGTEVSVYSKHSHAADADIWVWNTCTVCGIRGAKLCTGEHLMTDPTCTSPATCTICGYTDGDALGHDAPSATCTTPSVCSRCSETIAPALGHDLSEVGCTSSSACSRCGYIHAEALGHDWKAATCT